MSKTVEVYLKTVALAILVASLVLPTLVRGLDYNAGVKVGDWIKYGQFTVNWTGNGTEPSYVTEEKKIQWTRIDVENVSGTTITYNLTTQYDNGTQMPQTLTVDVANGSMGGFFFIASNLKSGDRITNGTTSAIINQTTTGTYAGATRNVNVVNVTTTVFDNLTITSRVYWDQTTGIMVEAYTKTPSGTSTPSETIPSAYVELSAKATETNMWSADIFGTLPNNLIYIVAGIIVIIIIVGATFFLRRRKPPSPQQPPPPPPSEGQPSTPP